MLRVVLVVSNFLEAPNGGGAGSNRQPAGRFSLRERCDCRGNNPQPAAKDLRAVALRTRKHLAEAIVSFQHYNAVVRPEGTGSPEYTKLQPTGADLPDQSLRPQKRTRHLRRASLGRNYKLS